MKKIILLLLATTGILNGMEERSDLRFEQLPQEVQSLILSFVLETNCFKSCTKNQLVCSQFRALLTDQAFINNFAERLANYNMPLAEKLLLKVSACGHYPLAEALLKAGVNPNGSGVSPFDSAHFAALPAELKEKHHIDPEKFDGINKRDTPLLNALNNNQIAIAEILVAHGALVNRFIGKSPLLTVMAARGDQSGVTFLLDHGANINAREENGETALWWAVWNNQPIARLLVERGAKLDILAGDNGVSPMMIAANRGDSALVELLLSKGAQVNLVDHNDTTALEYALLGNHKETAELLTAHGGETYNEISDDESDEDLGDIQA